MIENLKKNISTQMDLLREISTFEKRKESTSDPREVQLIDSAIMHLANNIKTINESVPQILEGIPELRTGVNVKPLEKINYGGIGTGIEVTLQTNDRERFLKDLSISENLIRKVRRKEINVYEEKNEFRASKGYLKFANEIFLDKSQEITKKGYFRELNLTLKKANIDILFETYVSMMLLTTILSIFGGIILFIFLIFFNVNLEFPFLSIYDGEILIRLTQISWIPLAVPLLTFFAIYFYPFMERGSQEKGIDQELPFAVIYMSAISGSGIPPIEIFRIVGLSREYPRLRREIRKVMNQINIYGYDLVTALNNASKSTPSQRLSELFSGLSTTIHSGGSLKDFFEKRAETLLAYSKLEREKAIKTSETFMDIYISIVIAAPMILMLLLIMMSVPGMSFGLTPNQVSLLIIGMIAVINVGFLTILQLKQPAY